MKTQTLSFLTCMALLLSFISCTSNVQELESEQLQLLKQIVMTTEDFEPEADSRTLYQIAEGAVKCSWASNDTVGVFPDKGMQTCFPMTSENGMKNATFDGGGWALKDGSTYGAYYPFIGNMYLDKKSIPVSYKKQTQVGNGSIAHLGTYDYMVATPVAPEFGSAHFTFKHLGVLVQLRLTIPQAATLTSMKLVTEIKAFALEGKVNIMADAPSISPIISDNEIELTLQDISTTEENQVVTLYMVLPPANLSEQTLKAVVVSNKGTLEYVLENKNFQAGKAYALTGTIKEAPIGNGTYQNGVVSIAEAGTMKKLLGDDYLNITSLKVIGPINGDDVYYLRMMIGGSEFNQASWGKLITLDLSEATIVEGGDYYYYYKSSYPSLCKYHYTSNNTIGDYMFYDCDVLQNIILPNNLLSISERAFSLCSALTYVKIPNSIKEIKEYAFADSDKLATIAIEGNGSTTLGSNIFKNCDALTSAIIGDGVIEIGDRLFDTCSSLEEVTFGDNILIIPQAIFDYCNSLKKITIGNGVKTIAYAIAYHWDAKDIEVYISDLKAWCNIDCTTGPMMCGGGKLYLNNKLLTEVTIPDGVTNVGSVFEGCASITKVTIPEGVVSVGSFDYCTSLTSIQISNSVESLYGFDNCTSLTNITIPNSVTSIYSMQNCTALTEVKLGNGITSICDYMFRGCNSLKKVTIGNNVEEIGILAFENTAIEEFYSYSKEPPSIVIGEVRNYGGNWYDGTSFLDGIKEEAILYIPSRSSDKYQSSQWSEEFKNIREM